MLQTSLTIRIVPVPILMLSVLHEESRSSLRLKYTKSSRRKTGDDRNLGWVTRNTHQGYSKRISSAVSRSIDLVHRFGSRRGGYTYCYLREVLPLLCPSLSDQKSSLRDNLFIVSGISCALRKGMP